MTDWAEDLADKASTLLIAFKDCTYQMENVMKFTKLRELRILNECNKEFLLKLSKQMSKLKELNVDEIVNGNEFEMINICRQFKFLEVFYGYMNKTTFKWYKYGNDCNDDDYKRIIKNTKTVGCNAFSRICACFMRYVETQQICHLGKLA